jgi:ATP-dependent helicase/nuclease subunit B
VVDVSDMKTSVDAARIFTVPPGVPFLPALANALLTGGFPAPDLPPPDAISLAGYDLFVPTRRAARALAETFVDTAAGKALLLPRILPLADVDEDELILSGGLDLGRDELLLDVPPAIGTLARQLLLTRFILRWENQRRAASARASVHSPAQAAHLAAELARLIDAVETERADWNALEGLVEREFSAHWTEVLDFLDLLRRDLPGELDRRGVLNPMARRNLLLEARAAQLRNQGSDTPVIAAGSTGSIPATAELLKTIATLDRGAIVLPGLDQDMDEASWREVGPNHPQYGMRQLLERIGVTRDAIVCLPGVEEDARQVSRRRLVAEVVRPAATTDRWIASLEGGGTAAFQTALDGVHPIVAPAQREEALAIALIVRHGLETEDRSVALVTPDRGLARRVVCELGRWNIAVDDSAGTPLQAMPHGALAMLLIDAAAANFAPVELLALLKHPLATFGRARKDILDLVSLLELAALRGTVSPRGFGPLLAAVKRASIEAVDKRSRQHRAVKSMSEADWQRIDNLIAELRRVLEPFAAALETAGSAVPRDLVVTHLIALEAVGTPLDGGPTLVWSGDSGEALAELFASILESAELLPPLTRADYAPFLARLMAGHTVRPRARGHARVHIWGPLEARLMQADVMILGGLNEGLWPQTGTTDPFLNRPMRNDFGLEPPERRIGLSAHDFVQGLNAREAYLTWSEKVDGTPIGPSRWLLRLKTLTNALEASADRHWVSWALGLDHAAASAAVVRPNPCPPVCRRPRRMSVTRIEEWLRDPYATYARYILELSPVDPLAEGPGAADRGTLIHEILHRYAQASFPQPPADPLAAFLDTGREVFETYLEFPEVVAFRWTRFTRIAAWLLETDAFATPGIDARLTEKGGEISFAGPAGPFLLTAKADRIDVAPGGWTIFDYKTGAAASEKQMASGLSPQLPLEAAIALHGGFDDRQCADVIDLVYMRLSGGAVAGERRGLKSNSAMDLAAGAHDGLLRRIALFDHPETGYAPREVPEFERWPGDFDHLSRYREWSRTPTGEAGK